MSIDERIRAALTSVVNIVKPVLYSGDATEYIVFSYTEIPEMHAEGKPNVIRYLVSVHYYCPWQKNNVNLNPSAKKIQIKSALFGGGFTYPSVINASDADGQHYVFECEGFDGEL